MDSDFLLEIFEKHLFDCDFLDEDPRLFAARVIAEYLNHLEEEEGIYISACNDDVYLELEDEVICMLRKKTYGFFNLKEFRIHQKRISK